MSPLEGFSHLVVHVTDLDRSEKFYREAFGLDLIGRDLVNDEGPNVLLGMNTRQRVLLVEVEKVVPFRPNSGSIHHAWLLTPEEYKRAQQRLAKMGFDITDSRAQFRAVGEYSMDVFDPDGHRYQVQAYEPTANAVMPSESGPVTCGHVDEFPVGTVRTFVRGRFFLVRFEGGFLAISRWCTHMNGLLVWKTEHWSFYCPMHGAMFSRKGITQRGTRHAPPLRIHPLTIDATGIVTVDPTVAIDREDFSSDHLVPVPSGIGGTAARPQ